MAASSLGASNIQNLSMKFSQKTELCLSFLPHTTQTWNRPQVLKYAGIRMLSMSNKTLTVCQSQSSLIMISEKEATPARIGEGGEQRRFSVPVSQLIPNTEEVKSLLIEICDSSSIAEFELKLNGFHLHVMRAGDIDPPPLPSYPSVSASIDADAIAEVAASNGSVPSLSLAISKAGPSEWDNGTLIERAADEGLVLIQSPKVGFFRRSRTIKGKRASPSCKEKQVVIEGQVICYIEQLGGEIPVESDVSGEVIRILRHDGEAVGYGDAIIAILPSFPGIKMLPS